MYSAPFVDYCQSPVVHVRLKTRFDNDFSEANFRLLLSKLTFLVATFLYHELSYFKCSVSTQAVNFAKNFFYEKPLKLLKKKL